MLMYPDLCEMLSVTWRWLADVQSNFWRGTTPSVVETNHRQVFSRRTPWSWERSDRRPRLRHGRRWRWFPCVALFILCACLATMLRKCRKTAGKGSLSTLVCGMWTCGSTPLGIRRWQAPMNTDKRRYGDSTSQWLSPALPSGRASSVYADNNGFIVIRLRRWTCLPERYLSNYKCSPAHSSGDILPPRGRSKQR